MFDLAKIKMGSLVVGPEIRTRAIAARDRMARSIRTDVRYLGVDIEDALALAEGTEI
ncbi:hypothetical protein [Chelativorans xinjiangense]|uniref:hypothetical protein n=1 Tax=Chelativorans xinjiangense TaxID=2681485 RepID=UPI001FE61DBD|nr:hypothetical protein [Chelativorans xinjiangense]